MRRRSAAGAGPGVYRRVVEARNTRLLEVCSRMGGSPPLPGWPEGEPIEIWAWELPDFREVGASVHDRIVVHPDDRIEIASPERGALDDGRVVSLAARRRSNP